MTAASGPEVPEVPDVPDVPSAPAVAGGAVGTALVLVAHVDELARGVRTLAEQMAPGVEIIAIGGGPSGAGEIGTDFVRVHAALGQLEAAGRDAVVLADLGSAVMVVGAALDALGDDASTRFRLVDAPFVEGAVLVAVALASGGGLEAGVVAATSAVGRWTDPAALEVRDGATADGALRRAVEVRNPLGLHARPAAVLARMVGGLGARVTIDGADAASVIALMRLGVSRGQVVEVVASGDGAAEALDAVTAAITDGFGEV